MNYFPITINNESSFSITNTGTAPTPCKLTIIPKIDILTLTITGLSAEPIVLRNIYYNSVVIIDGETGLFTINDVANYNNYDAWEFPKLQPGINNITITNASQCEISIEFEPRYI